MSMYPWIEKLPIHDVTKQLVMYYLLDLPLPETVKGEFGVETMTHYLALRAVLFSDDAQSPDEAQKTLHRRILEVEAALGNGPMLNKLVQKYALPYAEGVHFQTLWDALWGRTDKLGF